MLSAFQSWSSGSGDLSKHVVLESERTLKAYVTQPTLIREHVGIEANIFSGGYGRRQIYELVQNAADAIVVAGKPGRVSVVLTEECLYCANEGAPIDHGGVTAILSAYISEKRGAQIGHFGLGFKSVLNVTSAPQFFCRQGSFGFDRDRSLDRIQGIVPGISDVPVLRLAHLLDAPEEAARDTQLAELMEWATTVIRLPRNLGNSSWLSEEIAAFPEHFLIFSPSVRVVELHDKVRGLNRVINVQAEDDIVIIAEEDKTSAWAVFRRDLSTADLSREERDDADRTTRRRETLPLIWAVPEVASRSRGRFWAFFPTETETTLSGILNAPWKTNADRQNLLDGPFNRRLLHEFVGIIANGWSDLYDPTDDDPGWLFDLLPARERDEKNWADGALSQGLYSALRTMASVPNGAAELVKPDEVTLRPDEAVTDGGREWVTSNPRAENTFVSSWVHPSLETRERRSRVERLGCRIGGLSEWLLDIASTKTPASCRRALALLAAFWPSSSSIITETTVKSTAFVLTTKSELIEPDATKLCLPVRHADAPEGMSLVHKAVAGDEGSSAMLRRLGIRPVGVEVQLNAEIRKNPPDWNRIWNLIRALPQDVAAKFVRAHSLRLQVRTLAGTYVSVQQTLLPGSLVDSSNESEDAGLTVDTEFHKPDLGLVRIAGGVDAPQLAAFAEDELRRETWFQKYMAAARKDYRRQERRAGDDDAIAPVGLHAKTPGPLHALVHGSLQLRAKITGRLIDTVPTSSDWSFHYKWKPRAFPTTTFVSPFRWCLKQYGVFQTSLGLKPVQECVGPMFADWRHFLPVANVLGDVASVLSIPQAPEEFLEGHWRDGLAASRDVERLEQLEEVWKFYAEAGGRVAPPQEIAAYAEGVKVLSQPSSVYITDDRDRFVALQEAGSPCMLVSGRAAVETIVAKWGCSEGVANLGFEATAEPVPMLDLLPGLAAYVTPTVAETTLLQPCARIWLETKEHGQVREHDVQFAQAGVLLCYRSDVQVDSLLSRVAQKLKLNLSAENAADALAHLNREQRRLLLARVRTAKTVPEKLLAAVGESAISKQLPRKVLDSALAASSGQPTGDVLSRAAVAVFGVELLKTYGAELVDAGFDPPRQWNGGQRTAAFCEELGFPAEYAGFASSRRDPMLEVDGPVELKPLHDFQEIAAERICTFVARSTPDRGLLSLPTGAGKTRVVVEALIRAINKAAKSRVIIWIAQTNELCEQAVQAWHQAWRSLGPPSRLRVSRLWGPTNDLVRWTDDNHVVVCTYQSLGTRINRPDYSWLLQGYAVVIDEAHGSTASAYTQILHALGLTPQKTERHLIGMTATPFRGSGLDEEETRWLANRYGQNRFDHGTMPDDDPYPYLQRRGILAEVDQQLLEGREIRLTAEELQHLDQYRVLPPAAEQRLGDDDDRNKAIVDLIRNLDASWPILLFATSVNHAQLMAALLCLEGVDAKAITASTDPGARRYYVEEFKAGRIRALTNYNVLTTGFDAPAVRALVIARPVYSRGLYQQMIGRGLRGPKNGGKKRCLIVNITDNVAHYGDRLAFREFEHLWQPWG